MLMLYLTLVQTSLLLCVFAHIKNPSIGLNEEEKKKFLDLHNEARRREPASDMYELEWDEHLAISAMAWAKECNFTHGFKGNAYDADVGQNLYFKEGDTNKYGSVKTWVAERMFYDYDKVKCSHPPCGHYTQAVWARSQRLGCAHYKCDRFWWPSKGKYLTDTHNIVCHYWPPGNIVNMRPYITGEKCSKCVNGKGWCHNGMCQPFCEEKGDRCDCPGLDCDYCGETNPDNCTCSCKKGFYGQWCQKICRNLNPQCEHYEPVHCKHTKYGEAITANCPLTCGVCDYENDKNWTCEGKNWEQVFGVVDANPTRDRRGCFFPFVYNQTYHDQCVQHVTGVRVCSRTPNLDKYKSHYLSCPAVVTEGGNDSGAPCQFSFIYRGEKHYDCLPTGGGLYSWCATTRNYDTDRLWGYCPESG